MRSNNLIIGVIFSIIDMIICSSITHANNINWHIWVDNVRKEALAKGITPTTFDAAFATIHEPSRQVQGFLHSQPEKRLTFNRYLQTRADNYRISMGRKYYAQNKKLLDKIGQDFAVDPCFIVAFWGMESSYGTYLGDFPVIKSLATLAYDSNRKDFFRNELFLALQILQGGHVTLANFKGEWAGASGQPQFLPSSWVQYAVDYDADGHKNIWTSKADVFASIANYMKQNGWHAGEPWAIHVKLPRHFNEKLIGKSITKSVGEWDAMGVRTLANQNLPYSNLKASIVHPNGGPVFLAFPNYKMIIRYNNSIYYAGAIGYIADNICLLIRRA